MVYATMKTILNKSVLWDYFVVVLLIISSDAVFFKGRLSGSVVYPFLLLISLVHLYITKSKITLNSSIYYILWCFILCILNYLKNSYPLQDKSMMAFFCSMFATYFIISNYNYEHFKKLFTDVVYLIVLFGIPIFIASEYSLIPLGTIIDVNGQPYYSWGIYTLGWDPHFFHRFSGIWHEPGACQIILNTALWLNYNSILKWNWEKGQLKKCLVILVGSLMTMSTGSYIVLMLLFLAILINVRIRGKYKLWLILLLLIIVPASLYLLFMSPVVQNKLFDADGEMESKVTRLADVMVLWQMIQNKPILGYGIGTTEFWRYICNYGNCNTYSGILAYTASLGISWLLVYMTFLWKGCKQLKLGRGTICLVIAIVLMQFDEYFIEFPVSCVFLFKYASYNKINLNTLTTK